MKDPEDLEVANTEKDAIRQIERLAAGERREDLIERVRSEPDRPFYNEVGLAYLPRDSKEAAAEEAFHAVSEIEDIELEESFAAIAKYLILREETDLGTDQLIEKCCQVDKLEDLTTRYRVDGTTYVYSEDGKNKTYGGRRRSALLLYRMEADSRENPEEVARRIYRRIIDEKDEEVLGSIAKEASRGEIRAPEQSSRKGILDRIKNSSISWMTKKQGWRLPYSSRTNR